MIDFRKGFTVPLISIHRRSGSGKSTLVKAVCENIDNPFVVL